MSRKVIYPRPQSSYMGNRLKDSADYAAYKEENEDALPKFKFRKLMIDEFKSVLMPEIAPLTD